MPVDTKFGTGPGDLDHPGEDVVLPGGRRIRVLVWDPNKEHANVAHVVVTGHLLPPAEVDTVAGLRAATKEVAEDYARRRRFGDEPSLGSVMARVANHARVHEKKSTNWDCGYAAAMNSIHEWLSEVG